jgi:hypothetical protein
MIEPRYRWPHLSKGVRSDDGFAYRPPRSFCGAYRKSAAPARCSAANRADDGGCATMAGERCRFRFDELAARVHFNFSPANAEVVRSKKNGGQSPAAVPPLRAVY